MKKPNRDDIVRGNKNVDPKAVEEFAKILGGKRQGDTYRVDQSLGGTPRAFPQTGQPFARVK